MTRTPDLLRENRRQEPVFLTDSASRCSIAGFEVVKVCTTMATSARVSRGYVRRPSPDEGYWGMA